MPLVLLPGLLCDAASGTQCVGVGGHRAVLGADLTEYETMKEMGESVLRDAPWKESRLAGLSMGGYVALESCARDPRRVTGSRCSIPVRGRRPPDETKRGGKLMNCQSERGLHACDQPICPLNAAPLSACKETHAHQDHRATWRKRHRGEAYLRQQRANPSPGLITGRSCRRSVSDAGAVRAPGTAPPRMQRGNGSGDPGAKLWW